MAGEGYVTTSRSDFAAIDFETADYGRDSACAVAIVRVIAGRIANRVQYLIRPPRKQFTFSHIHGITWRDVAGEPTFEELWPTLKRELDGVEFLAAHSAPFDRSVLRACCEHASVRTPRYPFRCTVDIARSVWQIQPTKLPDVCRRLDIRLKHHDALSDAEACAKIVIASAKCAGCRDAPMCFPARAACAQFR